MIWKQRHPDDYLRRRACLKYSSALALSIVASNYANTVIAETSQQLRASVCRVSNHVHGATNLGSGTLIDKTEDGREGLILTCAHLFREGSGSVLVTFGDGKQHRARLIDINHEADLAALSIASPSAQPAKVAFDANAAKQLYACGYGPKGIYQCAIGSRAGEAESSGRVSLLLSDAVRSGDSGGGVFDESGRLVAVIWGEAQGVTYASYGKPLRSFLGRILGRRTSVVYSCPGGVCPQRPVRPNVPKREESIVVDARWAAFQKQLDELRAQKQDRGDYVMRAELNSLSSFARTEDLQRLENDSAARYASVLDRLHNLDGRAVGKAAGAAAVGLLGLSGPAGWAVIAASTLGGWLIGRRMKRKLSGVGGRRRRRFRRA